MNPVFIFLVIVATVVAWFLCAFLFKPLGKLIFRIVKDAIDTIIGENEKETKKDE